MADDLKIKVNGREVPVRRKPGYAVALCAHQRAAAEGPRFGCGLAQCGSCSVLADGVEIRSCVTPVANVAGKAMTTLEGLPALYAQQKSLAQAPGAASAAAGVHRRAGDALRLLLQRHDHQGRRAAGAEPEAHRSPDPRPHGRPSLPLRHLSAGHEGDQARVRQNDGRGAMNTTSDDPVSRRDLLKGGGALIVGFSMSASRSSSPPRAAMSPARPIPIRSTAGSRSMPTTPRRSISASASSARATPPGCCRSPAKSSIST